MNYWFSSKNNAFYPVVLKQVYEAAGNLPDDLVTVTNEVFEEYSGNPPEGKKRGVGIDALPYWQDLPVITLSNEEIESQARKVRNAFIYATDNMMISDYTIKDTMLSEAQREELMVVRAAFKRWPEEDGWPLIELPNIPKWVLIEALSSGYEVSNWPK
ncbi:tail fiber assembly protein [Enterobacteriaceae bacterium]